MFLRWVLGDSVVDGNTLKPGKELWLQAIGDGQRPCFFNVYKTYPHAYALVRRLLGGADRIYQVTFLAEGVADRKYLSDTTYSLPAPYGGRLSSQFIFTAEPSGEKSGIIRSNAFGEVKFGGIGGLDLGALSALTPVPVPVPGVTIPIEVVLRLSSDPLVTVSIETGEDLAHSILKSVDKALTTELNQPEPNPARQQVRDALIDACTPPEDWTYTLDIESADVEAGTDTTFTFTLEAPSPGTGAFVIFVEKATSPWGDDYETASDVLAFKSEAGRLFAGPVPLIFDPDLPR
jgi:hypothetical protein